MVQRIDANAEAHWLICRRNSGINWLNFGQPMRSPRTASASGALPRSEPTSRVAQLPMQVTGLMIVNQLA